MKHSSKKPNVFKDQRGYTALIALGLSLVIMYFALDVAGNIQTQGRNIQAFKDSSRAYFLADSLLRNLIAEGKGFDAGRTVNVAACEFDGETDDITDSVGDNVAFNFMKNLYEGRTDSEEIKKIKIKCSVEGVSTKQIGGKYIVPEPNTGDAGKNCGAVTASAAFGEIDHPCNWGRLNFGNQFSSRVAIPLYYFEGTAEKNPSDTGLSELKIKVRTPCTPEEVSPGDKSAAGKLCPSSNSEPCLFERTVCLNTERYDLDAGTDTNNPENDESVVTWQISGLCDNGESEEHCNLVPWIARDNSDRNIDFSSEIYDSLINKASDQSDNVVINIGTNTGIDIGQGYTSSSAAKKLEDKFLPTSHISIANFLKGKGLWDGHPLSQPVLQLGLIAQKLWTDDDVDPAESRSSKNIPYLEYQIITDKPVSNSRQKYVVEVYYNGQAYKAERTIEQKKNVVDFAIQN